MNTSRIRLRHILVPVSWIPQCRSQGLNLAVWERDWPGKPHENYEIEASGSLIKLLWSRETILRGKKLS